MPYINHRSGKTFYTVKGRAKEGSKPIIFLHGGPGGFHDPESELFQLSKKGRKVFLYDQLGGGKSTPLKPNQMKLSTFIRQLDELVKFWGLKEFHLGGGSWGTTLALEYYKKHGKNRVKSLIFQSPLFSSTIWKSDAQKLIKKLPAHDQKIIAYCDEIGAHDATVYKEVMFKYYRKHVLRDDKKLEKFLSSKNPNGASVYKTMWGENEFSPSGILKNYDGLPLLSCVRVPTLFICGEHDEATPESVKYFSSKVDNSQTKIIKGASHIIYKEKPKEMMNAINNFLKETDEK